MQRRARKAINHAKPEQTQVQCSVLVETVQDEFANSSIAPSTMN